MEIQKTEDYEKFTTITGNRTISSKKVDRIVEDVKNGLNLFPYCPIIVTKGVDEKLNIVDGQHRFTASRNLEQPIYFVIAPDIKLRDIARLNTNTDKWNMKDFLECYIKLGQKDYAILKDFMSRKHTGYKLSIALLMNGVVRSGSSDLTNKFKDGLFEVNFLDSANKTIELVDYLLGHMNIYRDLHLISAIYQLQKKNLWDLERMKDKIIKNPKYIDKQSSAKNYIYMLEQIYNIGNQNRSTIF